MDSILETRPRYQGQKIECHSDPSVEGEESYDLGTVPPQIPRRCCPRNDIDVVHATQLIGGGLFQSGYRATWSGSFGEDSAALGPVLVYSAG